MLSIFNLSGGTAQSGRSHCSIQAEPLLNFAGRADFAERRTHFAGAELKNAIRRTMKELMCAPACGAIVWGFVIETAEIGVSLLNLQLPIAFDFDLCYHANAELLDCPEL